MVGPLICEPSFCFSSSTTVFVSGVFLRERRAAAPSRRPRQRVTWIRHTQTCALVIPGAGKAHALREKENSGNGNTSFYFVPSSALHLLHTWPSSLGLLTASRQPGGAEVRGPTA